MPHKRIAKAKYRERLIQIRMYCHRHTHDIIIRSLSLGFVAVDSVKPKVPEIVGLA